MLPPLNVQHCKTFAFVADALFRLTLKDKNTWEDKLHGLCMWWVLAVLATVVYVVLCLLLCYHGPLTLSVVRRRRLPADVRRVLVVVAHPDDECMFFGPTIAALTRHDQGPRVHLLCLSTGNFEGLGRTRKSEFSQSCRILGLDGSNVVVVNHTCLPDDASVVWDKRLVAAIVLRYLAMWDVDTLVTFGRHGVSGHHNHVALYRAVRHLVATKQIPTACQVFTLDDVSILRKYLGIFDVVLSVCLSRYVFVSTPANVRVVKNAMAAHESQMVWFRKLYLIFSRYVVVNCLQSAMHDNASWLEESESEDDF